jgi:2-polyprenyl-6-hydroxyphenyl methylase / 3-demethylubiquinone-9 3-methyltransferase
MQPTSDEVYKQINNDVYDQQAGSWWDENQCLHLLKSSVNPARAGYFRRLLDDVLKFDYRSALALDVGCGGGILARMPRRKSISCAAMLLAVALAFPATNSLLGM